MAARFFHLFQESDNVAIRVGNVKFLPIRHAPQWLNNDAGRLTRDFIIQVFNSINRKNNIKVFVVSFALPLFRKRVTGFKVDGKVI